MIEFTVKKFDLLKELTFTQGVVEKKATIPILQNVMLEAEAERLSIVATDLEIGIKTSCETKLKSPGAITVPAKRFFDIVRAMPDADIKFKAQENNWATVTCQKSSFKLVGTATDNFPAMAEFKHPLVTIPARMLARMINRTIFAISAEESRYTLNGALLLLKPNSMTMVSTDGHRLAHIEQNHEFTGLNTELRALIPKKAMAELTRLLGEADEKAAVEMGKDEDHLFFKLGNRLLVSRMLSGQFPNYEAVLPRENEKSISMAREEFLSALRRVSLLSDERSHAVKLNIGEQKLEISSSHADYGEAHDELEVDYSGAPLEVGFNGQYILDFLSVINEDKVSFEFKDEQSAGLLKPVSEEGVNYRYIVMPMRI
jgi:DNA polymerase III subunit beta